MTFPALLSCRFCGAPRLERFCPSCGRDNLPPDQIPYASRFDQVCHHGAPNALPGPLPLTNKPWAVEPIHVCPDCAWDVDYDDAGICPRCGWKYGDLEKCPHADDCGCQPCCDQRRADRVEREIDLYRDENPVIPEEKR